MNILHLKYAVEVEKTASITKAAENLYMGQPNLSRSIKELEESVGIKIFRRTSKGIIPTIQGEEFLREAKKILMRIESLESAYKNNEKKKVSLNISVPRSNYITVAFGKTVASFDENKEIEIVYSETSTATAFENILQGNFKLGIVRVQEMYLPGLYSVCDGKDLRYEEVSRFKARPIVCAETITSDYITKEEFASYIEIDYGEDYLPLSNIGIAKKNQEHYEAKKKLIVCDRASAVDLIKVIPYSYIWAADMSASYVQKVNLKHLFVEGLDEKNYVDLLITKRNYNMSLEEKIFIENIKLKKSSLLHIV